MLTQYLSSPKSIKELGREIRKVCDDYWSRKLPEELAKKFILNWASTEGKKLFSGNDLNPTIKIVIGKKREELVNKFLEGTQYSLFSK